MMTFSKESRLFWKISSDFLNNYMQHSRGASKNTIETYRSCLNYFIDYLEHELSVDRRSMSFENFDRSTLKAYMSWMNKEKKLSPKTCNLRLAAIHSLLDYAADESIELMSICAQSHTVKGMITSNGPIEYMESDVMRALLAAPGTANRTARRNRMMLIFLYDTAARVSEALSVKICDLHLKADTPFVTLLGKGNKHRNIPLMSKTIEHLEIYLSEFHVFRNKSDSDTPLFYAKSHGIVHKLSADTVETMLKKYSEKISTDCGGSITTKIHCHMIRKTRAMDLYQSGVALAHIQQFLGHENVSTTSGFYAFATLDTIAKSIEKATPDQDVKLWKNKNFVDKLLKL
jgi:site-specific recombinase XerD